uniref:EB domain-containing protein n=1 Tax=Macrostomum lignano TaxID=282301 RepID=A0A1I8G4Q7_9PLAT
QFPSDADSLRDRASAVSQFSTRQRPCRCLAVKRKQQQTDCPKTVVQLRWRHPPPALQHYLAVNCALGDCEGVLADGCSQTRQRDCLCRPDNRSLYSTASARRCSLGWAIDATIERRFVGNFSSNAATRCLGRLVAVATPAAETGAVGTTGFSVIWVQLFPDVFKAVFVLVALVIALISCRGLCILVQ